MQPCARWEILDTLSGSGQSVAPRAGLVSQQEEYIPLGSIISLDPHLPGDAQGLTLWASSVPQTRTFLPKRSQIIVVYFHHLL